MRWSLVALVLVLAGCSNPQAQDEPILGGEEIAPVVAAWSNETRSGTFVGYVVFPVAAGGLQGDNEGSVDVQEGASLVRFRVETPNVEYYIAHPDCPDANVADCRSDTHYVDSEYTVYEVVDPLPGTWRYELAPCCFPPVYVGPVTWSMEIVVQLTGDPVLWSA